MDVTEAIDQAKKWLGNVIKDEHPTNIGLEEVEFDEETRTWKITLGFSRPWNSVRNAFTAISGEPAAKRAFRIIAVRDSDGKVLSMKRYDEE